MRNKNNNNIIKPENSFVKLLDGEFAKNNIIEGNIVKAEILKISKDYVLVDIGYKSEGLIPINEFLNVNPKLNIKKGDLIDVYIESCEDDTGHMILSKEKADKLRIWDEIEIACEKEEIIEGIILGKVKGGLQVDIGVKAFLPGSQVDLRPIRNLDKMIGKKYQFKVVKFNKKRGNIVLSRRILLEKDRESKRKITLNSLKENLIMTGIVKNLTDYGAFIDLGGVDGLLHVTDMSWGRIQNPSDLLEVGKEIKVKILKYDSEHERVSLGIKQIQKNPWERAQSELTVGTKVSGKIVSLTDYGVFVELLPGVEGLIHVSEMSWTKRIKHPSKIVNIGDKVEALVLDMDQTNKRISLGMKQVNPNPWTLLEKKYPIGAVIRGQIRNITDFGIFIGIEDGIDGLVHVSDLSWTHRVKHPSEIYKKSEEIEAVVLNIDTENERFSLGIKQLNEDPWDKIPKIYPKGSRVKGKVTKLTDFGAFIEIEPGIDGLCHISEISDKHIEDPKLLLFIGQKIEVMIIDIDSEERKIGLSIKVISKAEKGFDYKNYLKEQESSNTVLAKKGFGTLSNSFDKLKEKLSIKKKKRILKI